MCLSPVRPSALTPHAPQPTPSVPASVTVRGALLHSASQRVCVFGGSGIWGSWCISFISVLGPDSFRSLLCISQDEGQKLFE